jgi:hypothetical protein
MMTARTRVGLLAWTVALTLPAGAAVALWSVSGSGQGTARGTTAVALTVTAGTAPADLFPGAAGDVVFSVTNPNPFPVTLTSGTVTSISQITGAAGTCQATDFTLGSGSMSGASIAAGGTSTLTLTGAITMASTAGDGCQGAVVSVSGTVSGIQS